eukprot:Protomagalhaensia_sp_Gyna_25__526@NODE_1247_length_2026_cov_21_766482_g994_i0_p2_GENE_NODE_1247_length_2026_cov_21_766482_g994_i0NODE_1247_length_2026_cov_21_766482_g994_i0_p2_ORF_typecomplete_len169_score7_24dCMP_cyt_deam_1/PF00383_23/5e23MafB19deam/PF14437_6/2_8e12Bd3614deam/PF14439_6/1_7e03Bd3614deam/PF14439_6/0_0055SNAD4/PF18750_1/0_12APOBEC3/PF18771_1/0_053NAD1/PF18778_1/0_26APOBEC2/PF18772_1/0_46_NODE_1247_length_2026_cov_21_766482_g994_i012581764
MRLAFLVSSRANCRKRRVGAVIVKKHRIVSTGYNGTPTGTVNCLDGGCSRCGNSEIKEGQLLQTCVCLHAESNAIIEQGRENIMGSSLFVTSTPCLDCAKTIVQAGIKRVVYFDVYGNTETAIRLLTQSGVEVVQMQDSSLLLAPTPMTTANLAPILPNTGKVNEVDS